MCSLRDVHTQLSVVGSKSTQTSRRRRRKRIAPTELKKIRKELKPSPRQPDQVEERPVTMAANTNGTSSNGVADDDRICNPLAHWDYFSELETPFVTLEQTSLGNSDPAHKVFIPNPEVISEAPYNDSKKAIRKKSLHGTIASSEISFVVSLLSSCWSKSVLHTRVLSCTSSTGRFCDGL